MSQTDNSGKPAGSTAERRSTGMPIRPTTAKIRNGEVVITLPSACQDVQYRRYIIAITGMITFIPDGPHLTDGKTVTARKDGIRTYAPMPASTKGIRYRRVIRAGGIIQLTPISRPQFRWAAMRRRERKEEEQ